MKKQNTLSLGLCLVFFCCMIISPSAYANPLIGYRYQNGVGNVAVWLNYNSGIGYWESYVKNAVNNWRLPGWANPIYLNYVSSNWGSNMDFHRQSAAFFGGSLGRLAVTRHFLANGVGMPRPYANWFYAEIHINHDTFIDPTFSNDNALGTVIHEMGHAFGLDENNSNPYSIMCQSFNRLVQRVQKTDNDAINIIY